MLNFTDYKRNDNDKVVTAVLFDGTPEMAREMVDWLDSVHCVVDVDYINGELVCNPNEKYESTIDKGYYVFVNLENNGLSLYPAELFEAKFIEV